MTRNGKIARLPALVREELNVRLDEGEPGRDLVAWLNALPKVQALVNKYFQGYAVTEQNLSEWRRGGFEDWRGQQSSIESTRTLAEHSNELQLESNGGDLRPTRYRSYADRLAVLLSVDVFEHRQTVMQKEMDPKLRWELLKELLQQVSRLRKDDHRQARLMLDQQRCEQKEHREAEVAKEVQAEKLRNQKEQSYWALLRWGPLVQMFGGGDLGKFFADAILRLQTGADPVEVPEQLKQELEAFKESLAGGGAANSEQEAESADRTESDSIRVDPTGNPVGASGPAVAGQTGNPVGPPAPSIAPNRTESDLIRVDPTGKAAGSEGAGITCPGSEVEKHHLSPALSPAGGGGEGEELRVHAVQAVAGQAGQPVGPSAPSIAPNRTESDLIRVDPTGKAAGTEGTSTASPGAEAEKHHLSPALSPAGGGGEGEELRVHAVQAVAGQAGQPVGPSGPSIAPNRTESDRIQADPTGKTVGSEGISTTSPRPSPPLGAAERERNFADGAPVVLGSTPVPGSAVTVDTGNHLNKEAITNPGKIRQEPEEGDELDPGCVRPEGYGDTRDHYFFNHYRHMSWAQGEEAGKLPADQVKEYILKCLGDPMKRLEKIVKLGLGHEPTFDEPGTSWKSRQSRKRVVMSYPPGLDGGGVMEERYYNAGSPSFKSFGATGKRSRGNRERDLDD